MDTSQIVKLLAEATLQTLYMTVLSTFFAYLFGIPLGVLLTITDSKGIWPNRILNMVLGVVVNIFRSIPFLILLVLVLPFTRWIVGTGIGTYATIVPLVIAAIPFVARMIESSLKEVDEGVIEAALAMGTSKWKVVFKVLLPEARPSLLVGVAISITTILGYSAMAGFIGGSGLGAIAINYGYYRYESDIMLYSIILLVLLVQLFQEVGMRLAKHWDHRKTN